MLVLSRRETEAIIIAGEIRVEVVRLHRGRVTIGIDAPAGVTLMREELTIAAVKDGKGQYGGNTEND